MSKNKDVNDNDKPEIELIELGKIGVDSGTMMMCDPCYVMGGMTKDWKTICKEMKGMVFGKNISLNDNDFADGVIFRTGLGDGNYAVTLEIVNRGKWGKRVKSATITFIEDEDLTEMKDEKGDV